MNNAGSGPSRDVKGQVTFTMDGAQVFSGPVSFPPPVACLYVGASTGLFYEQLVITNLTATVSTP